MEQTNLCSFMPELMDLDLVSDEDVVNIINNHLGIKFIYNDERKRYEYKIGKVRLSINFGHFSFGNHERYIGTDMDWKTGGWGGPNRSIMDAIDSISRYIKRSKEFNKKKVA